MGSALNAIQSGHVRERGVPIEGIEAQQRQARRSQAEVTEHFSPRARRVVSALWSGRRINAILV